MLRLSRAGCCHGSLVVPARTVRTEDMQSFVGRGCGRITVLAVDHAAKSEEVLCRRAGFDGQVVSSNIGADWLQFRWTRHLGSTPGSGSLGIGRHCRIAIGRNFVCMAVAAGDGRAGLEGGTTSSAAVVVEKKRLPVTPSWIKPLLLKRHSKIPKQWDGLDGTAVLIDKPKGWTSFAVCSRLRTLTKVKKVGHAGTLDPMATGLLVLCLGKATKVVDRYQAMTKVYSGTIRLGELTPSGDADTEVTERLPWEHVQEADIETAKQAFVGDIMQVPPVYSALKMKGERLYEKARRGEEVDIPPRPVTIFELEVVRNPQSRQELDFRVVCSKGTYIRSLCTDLGRSLKSCAHLTALRREKIGELSVDDAWTVADLQAEYARLYQ